MPFPYRPTLFDGIPIVPFRDLVQPLQNRLEAIYKTSAQAAVVSVADDIVSYDEARDDIVEICAHAVSYTVHPSFFSSHDFQHLRLRLTDADVNSAVIANLCFQLFISEVLIRLCGPPTDSELSPAAEHFRMLWTNFFQAQRDMLRQVICCTFHRYISFSHFVIFSSPS